MVKKLKGEFFCPRCGVFFEGLAIGRKLNLATLLCDPCFKAIRLEEAKDESK